MKTIRAVVAAMYVGALASQPGRADAFAEDICYMNQGQGNAGGAVSCNPLPTACTPAGTQSSACLTAALAVFGASTAGRVDARSTVHTDATHLLAQAVGFSATDAYWIAAYDEAVDLGVFQPRNFSGQQVGTATSNIDGFVRVNAGVGGTYFHFNAPRTAGTNGLHPEAENAHVEPVLAHVRRWAVQGLGNTQVECSGSFTSQSSNGDYATGSQCYMLPSNAGEEPMPGTIAGTMAVMPGTAAAPLPTFNTGYQVVTRGNPQPDLLSPAFDVIVGGTPDRVRDARLGIYLHVLADRVSHHECTDQSTLVGPRLNDPNQSTFYFDFSNAGCTQDLHALRHIWETGVPYAQIPEASRTTGAALSYVYDELVTFAQARGVLRPGANTAAFKASVLNATLNALQVSDGIARMTALANAACARGYAPFPGTITCSC